MLSNGGITPEDLFLTSEKQVPCVCPVIVTPDRSRAYKRIVDFIHSQGTIAGIQLAHAGRKSSTPAPWLTDGLVGKPPMKIETHHVPESAHGHKDVWGPSAISFNDLYPVPIEMSIEQIEELKRGFVASTKLAKQAGYDVIEIHNAHGCV